MQAEELLNVISECEVLRDDIDDVRGRVPLTRGEGSKLNQAVSCVDKAKSILVSLFPAIRSLGEEVREELQAELGEIE
jgi:hypothetical protein